VLSFPLQLTVIKVSGGKIYRRIITTGIESKHKDFYTSGGPLNNFRIYTKKRKIYMTSAYVERPPTGAEFLTKAIVDRYYHVYIENLKEKKRE
jgi:uncharacterized protein involved in exopolysaccharide biosynthesis